MTTRLDAESAPRLRVLIVDDHPVVRSGIASLLATQADFEVVGDAANGLEAVTMARTLVPDLVLMDVRMPARDGVDATAEILRDNPAIKVVVLTTYASDGEVLRAIEAGAVGYLLKDVPHEELFRALRAVARGERYLAPLVTERLVSHWQRPPRKALTERELEVLRCVADGAQNKQIAATLGVTEPTVKAHLVRVFEKLGAENRTMAVRVALERRLIERE
jgi:DNA-binding NarL/FixJ family response regulator